MSLAELEASNRRRMLLDALVEDPNYSIMHQVLIGLMGEYGYASSDTRRDLVWLEENGLITTDSIGPDHSLPQSTITPLGEDVALGRKAFDGVHRRRRGG